MVEFLFHIPWYVPLLLGVFGVAIFVWANNRMRKREKSIGLGLVAAAVLVAVVSYLVETDSEQVDRRTREFARAIVSKDEQRIGQYLDPAAAAFNWDKAEIVRGAVYYAEETGLTGVRILGVATEESRPDFVSILSVWSQHSGGRLPIGDLNSQWRLEWVKTGDEWLIVAIIPLQIGQSPREFIERNYLERPAPSRPGGPGGR